MLEAVYTYDYQPQNDWSFFFTDNIDIMFKLISVNLPSFLLNFETMDKESGEKFYRKVIHPTEFSIEVYETKDLTTYQYFKIWFDLVYSKITQQFQLNPPIKNAVFMLNRNFTEPSRIFALNGIKLKGIEPVTFDYINGDPLTYSIKFAVEELIES